MYGTSDQRLCVGVQLSPALFILNQYIEERIFICCCSLCAFHGFFIYVTTVYHVHTIVTFPVMCNICSYLVYCLYCMSSMKELMGNYGITIIAAKRVTMLFKFCQNYMSNLSNVYTLDNLHAGRKINYVYHYALREN